MSQSHKRCPKCDTEKPVEEFGTSKARKDGLQPYCKECRNTYLKEWYKENAELHKARARSSNKKNISAMREKIKDYLEKHPCVDCGNDDIEVLEFDHRDASLKEFSIAEFRSRGWARVLREIEKCDVRCANCHRKRTRRQFGYWTFGDVEEILEEEV